MTILSGLVTICGKEFRHIRHDPLTLALVLGMPVLQLILFGFAVQPKVELVPTAVLNYDRHARSRALIQSLEQSRMFKIEASASSQAELQQLLRSGRVSAAIEIPEDFSASELYRRSSHLRVWVDESEALTALQVTAAAEAVGVAESLTRLIPNHRAAEWLPTVGVDFGASPKLSTATSLMPGLLGVLLNMIPLLLTALSIVKEKERGTWDQLLVTPMSAWSLVGGKLLAYSIVGFVEGCLLLVLMTSIFGVAIRGSAALLLFSVGLFLIPAVGLGLLVTAKAKHQAQALQMTYLIFLPSILISGFLFPRNSMPAPIHFVSSLLPTTYFIKIARGIIVRGATFTDLLPEYGAVLLLSLIIFAVGWRVVLSLREY